ncbi:MAG: hypothetical protein JNK67_26710 [Alphaproteobacteria bacterium]|nr:hypothetical protein [Alphaproteobacteria bacterium]
MERHNIFALALLAAAINGMVSPAMVIVAIFSWIWMPPFLLGNAGLVFFLSMLVTATGTLLLSGVPAALYERLVGDPTGRVALWIWAATSIAITLVNLGWRFGHMPVPGAG